MRDFGTSGAILCPLQLLAEREHLLVLDTRREVRLPQLPAERLHLLGVDLGKRDLMHLLRLADEIA